MTPIFLVAADTLNGWSALSYCCTIEQKNTKSDKIYVVDRRICGRLCTGFFHPSTVVFNSTINSNTTMILLYVRSALPTVKISHTNVHKYITVVSLFCLARGDRSLSWHLGVLCMYVRSALLMNQCETRLVPNEAMMERTVWSYTYYGSISRVMTTSTVNSRLQ